ncbi:MAG: hypothetical protein R3194_07675 [Limnobacter sp.]|nr:hypothetical protein [Limnobacter sp.]
MSLSIAYSNKGPYPTHPALSRQSRARSRFLSRTAQSYKVGSKVFINGIEGKVLGYNISDFGRWLGVSHPIIVELNNSQVFYCKLSDLSNEPNKPAFF